MKINSRPPQPVPNSGAADKSQESKTQGSKAFEVGGRSIGGKSLDAVSARFSAKDLEQPERAEQAVRESFTAMLESQPVSGALPGDRREALAEFMTADPTLHQQMLSYLRKTLN